MSRHLKLLVAFFGGSFVMHLVWENVQMPLYKAEDVSLWESFQMCLFATATGDMLFTLTLYLTVALIHPKLSWLEDRAAYLHPATWIAPIVVGVLLAVSFELWAIYAVRRWEYGSMPLVPLVHAGVTPVLQMIVIPLAATSICARLAAVCERR
jgi:hypothetical protein